MSSPIASTSSVTRKSKNPGLALKVNREAFGTSSPKSTIIRRLPSSVSSLSNTPELEPDWENDGGAYEGQDDENVQYIYIEADSPFYRGPSSSHPSSYISVSGFPFACDALAEDDPLFAQFPDSPSGEELKCAPEDDRVLIVDLDSEDMGPRTSHEWNLVHIDGPLDQSKAIRTNAEIDSGAPQYF